MALLHADNFSRYGDSEALMLNGVYASVTSVTLSNDPDGISAGKVLGLVSVNTPGGCRYVLPAAKTTAGVAARIWCPNLNFAPIVKPGIAFYGSGGGVQLTLEFDSTGRINVKTSNVTVVATTVNPVITATGWYHIECKLTTGLLATDSLEIRVEGITVLTLSAVDLNIDSVYQVEIGAPNFGGTSSGNTTVYWKDFVVWDGLGTYNNDFLGSVLVAGLSVTSDVSLNWTPSSGATGYEILDNVPPVDTTYISAGDPPPSPYVGALSNLPADVTSVKGLITYVRAAKSDGGDGSLQVGLISDPSGTPTTVLGADRPITVAQTYWADVFETDPETSAPWLPSAVDLAQIQIDRTT